MLEPRLPELRANAVSEALAHNYFLAVVYPLERIDLAHTLAYGDYLIVLQSWGLYWRETEATLRVGFCTIPFS
jgi:hypothetical protein